MSIVAQANKLLRELLAGRYDDPVGNVHTTTQAEFLRLAPMAQPCPRQTVRNCVTSDSGERPGFQADGEPALDETRHGANSGRRCSRTNWISPIGWKADGGSPFRHNGYCSGPPISCYMPATVRRGPAGTRRSWDSASRASGP